VTVGDLQVSPGQIPLISQPTLVSGFGFSWVRDRRDNPADATRGNFNNADLSIAGKPLGSSANFVRLSLQNSTYQPIRRRFAFARSIRFGVQSPIGNTLSTEIPLPERFFAGGGNSLRGFGLNQAGPRDPLTGFPVGGQALLVFNQELRFPMRLPFVGNRLGGALFYDAGNVFSRLAHITLRPSPSGIAQASGDLNYFSHTIGFGFRYGTPIGPVRVDLGYQLNPAQFFACPTNNPKCTSGQQQLFRLPRFQFFFNLGAIF
jgi:outer membrane protein assembly factor BamA